MSRVLLPGRDMMQDMERATAIFYSKKVECDCFMGLKELYKTENKMGCCSVCLVKVERKTLMMCAGCSYMQYCSKGKFFGTYIHCKDTRHRVNLSCS